MPRLLLTYTSALTHARKCREAARLASDPAISAELRVLAGQFEAKAKSLMPSISVSSGL